MASPPNRPEVQSVAGAAQFTGTTTADGLVQFDDVMLVNPRGADNRIIIWSVAYFETGAGTTTILDVFLRPVTSLPATARIPIVLAETLPDRGATVSFGKNGLVVPRDSSGPWDLVFVTQNKAADASIVVDWGIRPV